MIPGDRDRLTEPLGEPNECGATEEFPDPRALREVAAEDSDVITFPLQVFLKSGDQIGTRRRGEMKVAGLDDPQRSSGPRRLRLTRACQ